METRDEEVEKAVGKIMGTLPVSLTSEEYRDIQVAAREAIQTAKMQEREQFCTILEKLYQAGDNRKEMTMEYLMRIRSKDAKKEVTTITQQ